MAINTRSGIPAVTDDLKAIRDARAPIADDTTSYATALSSLPTIASIMGRLQAHMLAAQQYKQTIANSNQRADMGVLAGLLVLTASGRIALGLTPASDIHDIEFKRAGENDLRGKIGKIIPDSILVTTRHLSAYDLSDATGEAQVLRDDETELPAQSAFRLRPNYVDRNTLPGTPAAYTLQESGALRAFAKAPPALEMLVEEARSDLERSDQWAADAKSQARADRDTLLRASQYAAIRAYSAIATVGIWPANNSAAQASKHRGRQIASFRTGDSAKLQAIAELAYDAGNGMKRLSEFL